MSRPTYNAFVFDEIRRIGRAWYAANPDADRSDLEFMFEKIGEMSWRRLVDEKPLLQIFDEIGVTPATPRPPAPEPIPSTGVTARQVGALVTAGPIFRVNGQAWRWTGCTAFALPQLHAEGENIDPFLDWAIQAGFNLLRCFIAFKNIPTQMGRQPFLMRLDDLRRFLDKVCGERHLRVELTCGDMQDILPEYSAQHDYLANIADVAKPYDLVVRETVNEAFKNGVDAERLGRIGSGLQASGIYDIRDQIDGTTHHQTIPAVLDFLTVHSSRKDDWPRTSKDAKELHDGWDETNADGHFVFPGTHVPVVMDEPMGADETSQPGKRSNVPNDFFDYAATAALMGAGATFHATDLVYGRVPGPVQQQCAEAFVAGAKSIGLEMPLGSYTRGYLGDCPLEHDDATALRTFARIRGNRAEAIVLRPANRTRVSRAGWRIVGTAGPDDRVVYLER